MGLTRVEIKVSNPSQPERGERMAVLVDTGATLSVIPRSVLERLGIRPIGRHDFRAFGGVITREIGGIRMDYDGSVALVTAVFGEENDPPIMGVTALESLGYGVDPVTGKLVASEMLLLHVWLKAHVSHTL